MVDTRFSLSIQIMMTLACHREDLTNSDNIAKVLKTNPTFVRRLVANLVNAGLIQSFRGKGGGIKIALDPSKISLKDIYLAATEEKSLIKVHDKPVVKTCSVSLCINEVLCDLVKGIDQTTQNYLAKKTLNDLLKSVKA